MTLTVDSFISLAATSSQAIKALDPHKRLAFLNNIVDYKIGKALQVIEKANYTKKLSTTFIGSTFDNGDRDLTQHYGHIVLDDEKYYRISTCLNKSNMTIQIPEYERKYWDDNTYLCFTTGDLFLNVKTSDLAGRYYTLTDKGNIEYYLFELFSNKAIRSFGLVDDFCQLDSTKGRFDLTTVKMMDKFYDFKIKGCLSSMKPKYALKYAYSNDVEYFTSLEGIHKVYPSLSYSRQYLAFISKTNFNKSFDNPKLILVDGIERALYCIKDTTIDDFIAMLPKQNQIKNESVLDDIKELSNGEAISFIRSIADITITACDIFKIRDLFGRVTQETCNEALELGQLNRNG